MIKKWHLKRARLIPQKIKPEAEVGHRSVIHPHRQKLGLLEEYFLCAGGGSEIK